MKTRHSIMHAASRILAVVVVLAAQSTLVAQQPAADAFAAQQDVYLIVLQPARKGVPAFDPAAYGARVEQRSGARLVVRMTAEAAAALGQRAEVRSVQRMVVGLAARRAAGEAGGRAPLAEATMPLLTTNGVDVLTSGTYTYDGSGNVWSIGPDTLGKTDQFTYDRIGRLATAKVYSGLASHQESYEYDPVGNLTKLVNDGVTINLPVEVSTNRLSPSLGVAYDDAGNLIDSPVSSYAYDQLGMMNFDDASNSTYVYTPGDERLAVIPGSGYDGGLWRWTLRDLGGRKVREYESVELDYFLWREDDYHDGQRLIASQRETAEGGRRHYHLDHLGTPRLVTNAGGGQISTHDYFPFGVEITSLQQERARGYEREQTAHFTGHERDGIETWGGEHSAYLDYMHARFYNPNWGRFLSIDRAAANPFRPQTWNRYSYVLNQPVNFYDSTGLYRTDFHRDLTNLLAIAAGYTPAEAAAIAAATEAPDHGERSPTVPTHFQARRDFHFVSTERLATLRATAVATGQASDIGTYLHALQDTYSHFGYGSRVGHTGRGIGGALFGGIGGGAAGADADYAVDTISARPDVALAAAAKTYVELAKLRGQKPTMTFASISTALQGYIEAEEHSAARKFYRDILCRRLQCIDLK
ncbi:MAG TPA: RHS repeat-associated core domain-containing protein [Thermoanaerobaculia bacterium]|nr:RHS repeat-associated core domain-containing protein [Thermoanaerobaculia bacterium]